MSSCSIVTERLAYYSSYLAQLVKTRTNHASNVQIHLKFIVDSHTQTLADPGIYWGAGANQVLQSKVEGEARIEGVKRPRIEGEARVEGAKRLRIEGEARTEGEAREKTGEG